VNDRANVPVFARRVSASIGVLGVTVFVVADSWASQLLPSCLFRAATGWLCPGCGSARALHALLHGHLHSAVLANPLAVACVPLLPLFVYGQCVDRPVVPATVPAVCLWALLAAVIGFAIVRNVL
jgi:hypothetical protein